MITLYRIHSESPNIQKITIILRETGLPYENKVIERLDNGDYPAEFTAISPNATLPTIVDHDTGAVIFESAAILYYLAEKSRKLLPADLAERGEVVKWLMFEAANVGPIMGELYHYMLLESEHPLDAHLQRYKEKLAHFCRILDRQLQGRDFLCGEYSIADIALFPWTVILEDVGDIAIGEYANLHAWALRIAGRPALSSAVG